MRLTAHLSAIVLSYPLAGDREGHRMPRSPRNVGIKNPVSIQLESVPSGRPELLSRLYRFVRANGFDIQCHGVANVRRDGFPVCYCNILGLQSGQTRRSRTAGSWCGAVDDGLAGYVEPSSFLNYCCDEEDSVDSDTTRGIVLLYKLVVVHCPTCGCDDYETYQPDNG